MHALSAALAATAPTMSSLEIAELTGKEHKNVLRDARIMLDALGVRSAQFSANVPDAYGRDRDALALPKRECLILVSGYSVPLRAVIVDRWAELEARAAAPALPDFTDPAAAARAWAERFEGERRALAAKEQERTLRIAAQAEVEALKPAAAAGAHPLIHKRTAKTMWHIANWPRQSFAGRAYLSSLTRIAGALPQPKPSAHRH